MPRSGAEYATNGITEAGDDFGAGAAVGPLPGTISL
jgi:hypothetical protein